MPSGSRPRQRHAVSHLRWRVRVGFSASQSTHNAIRGKPCRLLGGGASLAVTATTLRPRVGYSAPPIATLPRRTPPRLPPSPPSCGLRPPRSPPPPKGEGGGYHFRVRLFGSAHRDVAATDAAEVTPLPSFVRRSSAAFPPSPLQGAVGVTTFEVGYFLFLNSH